MSSFTNRSYRYFSRTHIPLQNAPPSKWNCLFSFVRTFCLSALFSFLHSWNINGEQCECLDSPSTRHNAFSRSRSFCFEFGCFDLKFHWTHRTYWMQEANTLAFTDLIPMLAIFPNKINQISIWNYQISVCSAQMISKVKLICENYTLLTKRKHKPSVNENQQRKMKRHEEKICQRFSPIEMLSPTESETADGNEVMRAVLRSLRRPNKFFPINPQTANKIV